MELLPDKKKCTLFFSWLWLNTTPNQLNIGESAYSWQILIDYSTNNAQKHARGYRNLFFSLLILRQKSAQNYTSRKLEYSSPQTCYIASQIKDICHTHFFSKLHKKTALCKGLEGVEFGGTHQSFIMLKHKPKVGGRYSFV